MSSASNDREWKMLLVLAVTYLAAEGRAEARVTDGSIQEKLNFDPRLLEQLMMLLHNLGKATAGGGRSIQIHQNGIATVERFLQQLFRDHGADEAKSSGFGQHIALWQKLEWERYRVWKAIYDGGGGMPDAPVTFDKITAASELSLNDMFRAIDFLEHNGLAKYPFTQNVVLTYAGCTGFEAVQDELEGAEVAPTDSEAFVRYLERRLCQGSVSGETSDVPAAVRAELPDDLFQDLEGVWITASILEARYGIPNSRLKEWRETGCPDLGHKLRARKVVGVGWVYLRQDADKIADQRDARVTRDDKLDRLNEIIRNRRELIGEDENDE